jgi:hypothetical protein
MEYKTAAFIWSTVGSMMPALLTVRKVEAEVLRVFRVGSLIRNLLTNGKVLRSTCNQQPTALKLSSFELTVVPLIVFSNHPKSEFLASPELIASLTSISHSGWRELTSSMPFMRLGLLLSVEYGDTSLNSSSISLGDNEVT